MTSTIKVNTVTTESGSTLTLGGCGKTVALASGASQTGFGRTGTVDWQTGSIKTTTFTAANGEGYFVDTSSGGVTVNLPAGTAGAIVSFADYTRSFGTNPLTISPNGSNKIGGVASDAFLDVDGQSATFVFVDATEGWINIQETQTSQIGNAFIQASGGTESTSGNCKIHIFTGPGTFTVSKIACVAANNVVSHLVIAGGGAGGTPTGSGGSGGGGAGGFREVKSPTAPYTASPLDGYSCAPNRVTVTATAFPITVGGGGAAPSPGPGGACGAGNSGNPSTFSTVTSAGGGGGGGKDSAGCGDNGVAGGSGGGARYGPRTAGAGNTPPVSPAQGQNGGASPSQTRSAAGGGGAGAVGSNGAPGSGYPTGSQPGGDGGDGVTSEITASPVSYSGGGGGGRYAGTNGAGGTGGGGTAGNPATNGTDNTGGGGGGGSYPASGTSGAGGSGIVVIRYKFQ